MGFATNLMHSYALAYLSLLRFFYTQLLSVFLCGTYTDCSVDHVQLSLSLLLCEFSLENPLRGDEVICHNAHFIPCILPSSSLRYINDDFPAHYRYQTSSFSTVDVSIYLYSVLPFLS